MDAYKLGIKICFQVQTKSKKDCIGIKPIRLITAHFLIFKLITTKAIAAIEVKPSAVNAQAGGDLYDSVISGIWPIAPYLIAGSRLIRTVIRASIHKIAV